MTPGSSIKAMTRIGPLPVNGTDRGNVEEEIRSTPPTIRCMGYHFVTGSKRENVCVLSVLCGELAQRLESLRIYIRDDASLPQKLQELVMLTVAREMDCAYIWYAHAGAGREAGVRADIADNIREKRALTNLNPDEQAAVDFARELLRNRKVSRPTFDRASASFGLRGTLTLTNLIACYSMLAYNVNAYELETPAHATEQTLPITAP